MIRTGQNTVQMQSSPSLIGYASVVGKKEGEGPLRRRFDRIHTDAQMDAPTWEKAESALQGEALEIAMKKAGCAAGDIHYIFAGDLLNQCMSSTFGLRESNIPLIGQFGACSTMAQSLGLAAIMVDAGAAEKCAAVTASHFCTAERQFRYPLDYGGQRAPSTQWTVTGSGCAIVSTNVPELPYVQAVTFGKIVDMGVTDQSNMGAAMAGAAADTITAALSDLQLAPSNFDAIITGDLGDIGSDLLIQVLKHDGLDIAGCHADCGKMMFDREKQDVHAGASGCGCSASVLCAYILPELQEGRLQNVLFVATGALMSPTSVQQNESIPSIAHAVWLKSGKKKGQ